MCRCDGGVDGYVGVAIVAGCVGIDDVGVFVDVGGDICVAVAASGVINSSVVVVVGGGVVCVGVVGGVVTGGGVSGVVGDIAVVRCCALLLL